MVYLLEFHEDSLCRMVSLWFSAEPFARCVKNPHMPLFSKSMQDHFGSGDSGDSW
jgi:hypothetical protein